MADILEQENSSDKVQRIQQLFSENDVDAAIHAFQDLHRADQAEIFDSLSLDQQVILLPTLDLPRTADLLEELNDEDVLDVIERMSTTELVDVLDEMEPDEAADLLGDLPGDKVSELLSRMEIADDVEPLLAFPDETAGGLMTTSFIALQPGDTVAEAVQYLRQINPDTEIPYYLYVVTPQDILTGVVGLRDLVVSDPSTELSRILDPEVIYIDASADQEEAARMMSRYSLSALPVVDAAFRLIGVITYDDIVEVLEDEATEDLYLLANVTDSDLEPDSPILDQIKGRLPWMYLNAGTALLASWVISQFESVIANVAILAAFQTIVAGLGGNSASQNITMVVRSIAMGNKDTRTITRALFQQMAVGLLQGLAVGVVVGLGVYVWRGNFYLGLILGLAMIANLFISAIVGTLIPFGLKAVGQDPAIASTVLVTAITDSFGFFIFLSLAALFLPYLT